MRYEVQTLMGTDWENCWTEDEEPLTFATAEEAEEALAEHLADAAEAVASGNMSAPEDPANYRVRPVEDDDDGGRTRIGNTVDCDDCGLPQDKCDCGDREDEDADEDDDAQPVTALQSSFASAFDREEHKRNLDRRRELVEDPSIIAGALPGFRRIIEDFDRLMMTGELDDALKLEDVADRYAADLQGGDRCGMLCPDGSGQLLEDAAAAPVGDMPLWGQHGDFVRDVCGVPVRFVIEGLYGIGGPFSFAIHAVDYNRSFPSGTGYRSFCGMRIQDIPAEGFTVADYVTGAVEHHVRKDLKGKLEAIGKEYRERHAEKTGTPTQADELPPPPSVASMNGASQLSLF